MALPLQLPILQPHGSDGDFPFCGVELQKHALKYGLDFHFGLFAKFGHNRVFWF